MIRNLLALLGLAAIALVAAVGLQAYGYFGDDDAPPPRIAVSYLGLDLTRPEGIRILEQRVNAAIRDVCPAGDGLIGARAERNCRRDAIAMVTPQVERAVAAANARTYPLPPPPRDPYDDDSDAADKALPAYGAPPPPPILGAAEPGPPSVHRLVRRTTTTTVTRTGPAPVATRLVVRRPAPVAPRRLVRRSTAYARGPALPGSWLPPAAWRAIDRANASALATGRLTPWASPGRRGYVTPSAARRRAGMTCRNLRAVKFADGRQIVVASGTLCRDRTGRVVARDCR